MRAQKTQLFKTLSISILFLGFFITPGIVNAQEGTKQFMPNSNDRLWLEFKYFNGNNFGLYNCNEKERINIRLNSGEKVFFGMNMNTTLNYGGDVLTDASRVRFRVRRPSGTIIYAEKIMNTLTAADGLISTYNQAVAGPNGAILNGTTISGGYNPLTFTADETGDYYIEFTETSFTYNRFALQYFDVTVTDATNHVKTNPGEPNKSSGRLWSREWSFTTTAYDNYPVNANFFVFTSDEFINKVNFRMYPFSFTFVVNSYGVTTYTESNYIKRTQSQEGDQTAGGAIAEYRVFLNDPDRSVWPNTTLAPPKAKVWAEGALLMDYNYNRNPLYLPIDHSQIVMEKNMPSCPYEDVTIFKIESNIDGYTAILIDVDKNGEYSSSGSDRVIYRNMKKGLNYVLWNFKTDAGATVAVGNYNASATFLGRGPAHFPLNDVEQMDGITTSSIRPFIKLKTTNYWDDSQISNWGDPDGLMDETQRKQLVVDNDVPRTWSWRNLSTAHNGNLNTLNTWFNAIDLGYSSMGLIVQESATKCVDGLAPWVGDIYKEGPRNTDLVFTTADFTYKFFDPQEIALSSIQVLSLPAQGTLKLSGANIVVNQIIAAANLPNITYTPASNWSGKVNFEWKASNGTRWSNNQEKVYLIINTPPGITPITDQLLCTNTPTLPIPFTVSDTDGDINALTITGFSADPTFVPNTGVVIGGSGANRTVTVTPVANKSGMAIIYLMVDDGLSQVIEEFTVYVSPDLQFSGDTTVCVNQGLYLVAQENGATSYAWKYNGTTVSGGTSKTLDKAWGAFSAGNWSLTVVKGSCTSTRNFTVSISPLTTFSGDVNVCIGENISLSATEVNASYIWRKGATQVSTSKIYSIPSAALSDAATNYTLYVNKDGCTNTSSQFAISVVNSPNTGLAVSGNTVDPDKNGSITINTAQNGIVYNVYQVNNLVATGNGTGTNLTISIPSTYLAIGDNSFIIKANNGNCEVNLTNSAIIHVNTPGITVSAASANTTEAGGIATFTIRLNTEPSANVSIALSSSDISEGTVSPASLTFTSANYGANQTVTITGVDDNIIDGNIVYSIITAAASSADANYNGMNASDITVTNTDNDIAGVNVSPVSGLITTEAGGTASFSIVLTCQPTANVSINISSNDTGEGTVSTSMISFTSGNWNIPQSVTVTGVNDNIDDDNQIYTINTSTTSSTDVNFNGLSVSDVSATNTDNDVAGITVTPTSGLISTEAGGQATFTIVLNSEPTANVTIGISSSNTSEGTVSTSSITFTSSNWSTAQTITITGINDFVDDDNVNYSIITAQATGSDGIYNIINPSDVSVINTDDDTAGITVTPTSGLTTTESGGTASFTIRLNSQPTANVTIDISSSNTAEGIVSTSSLVFTTGNWGTAQTIIITGVNDDVDDGNANYSIITAQAASSDPRYSTINPSDVSVTNTDDDVAGVTVNPTSIGTTEAGGTGTFSLVLTSKPLADVTISFTGVNATEGSINKTNVVFSTLNWNIAQVVTVTGIDDVVADGNISYTIVTTASSTYPLYNGISVADVLVTNADNDVAGISVSPITLTTTEGGSNTFTIALNTQPTADVTINISSSDVSEGTVSPSTITFTNSNWAVKTITVTGVNDDIDDNDITYSVQTSNTISTDGNYNNKPVDDVSVTNIDDDIAGITITPTSGLITTEAGGTATFTVRLNSQPTANVTIGISSSNTSEGTVSPSSLTFTSSDWNTNQTVTITGINDNVDDDDVNYSIITSQVASADSKYSVINPSDVSITNTDNDIAGIIVTPTNGLVTTEAGGTVTFTVRLNSQPTANVTVGISSSNTSEGTVSPSSLTFTSSDWNTNQTVTITGVNDNVDDDDVNYSIITSQAASTDSKYSVINPSDVSVTNTDNDIAGIIVTPTNGLVTTEAGGTATFTICLNSQPTASVTIGISSSNTSEGAVSPSSIAFNAGDWNSPKTVTVTGVDDFLVDGNISYSIVTAQAVSADSKYSIINPSNVAVTNNDNDLAGMTVNPTTGLTTTEAGGTSTFTVRLNSQPTANVTIGISSSNTAEGIVSPSSLTFSSSDWNSNKTVTIAGVNDFVDDGNTSYTIVTAAATSTDANYNGLNAMDVPVTNIDNDVFGIIVSPTAGLYTREDGLQTSFTIRLNSQPTANVTIGISSSDIAEGTIDKSSVLFTPATWNINQTITITGVNDNVDDGDIAYSIITQAATSTDPLYNNVDAQNVSVTNQNDDIAGITLNSSTISINEGGIANTFTIVLNTEPTQNVTIGLSSNNTNKGTVSAASITFTPINWNSPQIISVTPVDNLIDDGDITFTVITDPATSLDDNYENKNASDLTVTSIDNDVKGINVTSVTGNTSETLTSSTFTIALNSEPTSDVTIGISSDDTGEGTVSPASVTFNSSNWNLPLTVTITGVDDAIADGNQTYHIVIAAASSSDANYNGVDADDITMVNSDNDSPGVTVFGITGLITTEAGGTATITVRLNSQPTADVKIDISSSDNTEGIVDIPSVTFTSANWNIQQTITITGIDDLIPDGDIPYTIQLANAVSTDPGYNNVDVQDVTVTNKDDVGPRATSDAASTDEDSEINIAVLANDKGLDNGGLTLSITQQPSHGSLIIEANNTITYKPNGLFNGNDTFKYSVCDGTSSCDEAIVTVTVTWKDDLPVAVPDARGTSKNTPVNLDVLFNDYGMEDGGIVVAIDEAATHGTAVRNADNTITFTPTAGYIGLATLVYKITDTDADSDTARVTINVREINTVPNAIDDAASTIKNNLVEISVLANDFGLNDGFGRLSTYLNPAHGTVTINAARTITYTPATNYIGNDSFRYLLEDVDGDYDIATVTIAVTEKLNSIPAAKPDRRGTNYQTPVTVDVLTNDTGLEDGVKSVTISSLPVNGGVVVNGDHSVTYTPNNGFSGIETFGYQVSDNDDDRSTATVTITVLPDGVTNHTPAAVDDAATTAVNTPVGVSVLANDTGLEDGFGGLS
ncbi:MAG: tandem-95 repeat protein, partial [Bacteroidales bacterium]